MTRKQVKSIWLTLAPYLGAVILDIALCALLVASGKELSVEAVVAVTGCVGGLLFFERRSGSGSSPAMVIASMMVISCGAPCQYEQTVVSALGAGLNDAAEQLPDSPDSTRALEIAQGAQAVGEAAVHSCEITRDHVGWRLWVSWALESAIDIVARFGAAEGSSPPSTPPLSLQRALMMLAVEYRGE